MPTNPFRRLIPDRASVRKHKALGFFGDLLRDPNLWHWNRRSVAGGVATGLFAAFVPIPTQMLLAAAAAIWLRVNLPIAATLVWITNPITFTPIFFSAFKLGQAVLGEEPRRFHFELSLDWLLTGLADVWAPLLLGCLIVSTTASILGYALVRLIWRYDVIRSWERRRASRRAAKLRQT